MFESLKEFTDLGSSVVITLAFLFVFYESQKSKKGNQTFNGKMPDILNELKLLNSNHLHAIENAINDGNKEIVKAVNEMRIDLSSKISELCGFLKSK